MPPSETARNAPPHCVDQPATKSTANATAPRIPTTSATITSRSSRPSRSPRSGGRGVVHFGLRVERVGSRSPIHTVISTARPRPTMSAIAPSGTGPRCQIASPPASSGLRRVCT